MTFQEIADKSGLSLRTVFRHVDNAEKSFLTALRCAGYNEEKLEKEFGDDKYIRPYYDRIREEIYSVAVNM